MLRAAEAALLGLAINFGACIADGSAADGATAGVDAICRTAAGLGGKQSALIFSLCRANEGRALGAVRKAAIRAVGAAERRLRGAAVAGPSVAMIRGPCDPRHQGNEAGLRDVVVSGSA